MNKVYFSLLETPDFTKKIVKLMDDDEYADFQMTLVANPQAGNLIRGGGGLRKIRWKLKGRGKRGGVRIIYYFALKNDSILLLDIYSKKEKTDLTRSELKELVKIKQEEID